jgi:trichodiene synthase
MSQQFPTQCYLDTMVRFLDTIEYHDLNYTHAVRVENLHYTYSKAAAHFAQPLQQETIKISPKKLQASLQSIVAMVVYSWVKVSKEVMADLSIHYTYMLILDDSTDDPDATMKTFTTDLLEGRPQQHYWWRLVNAQFPSLVRHYGPFCSLNLMRSTLDCEWNIGSTRGFTC